MCVCGGGTRTGVFDAACISNQRHIVALEEKTTLFRTHAMLLKDLNGLLEMLVLLHGLFLQSLLDLFRSDNFLFFFVLRANKHS